MKKVLIAAMSLILLGCTDNSIDKMNNASGGENHPRDVNEAIADSTLMVHDSVGAQEANKNSTP